MTLVTQFTLTLVTSISVKSTLVTRFALTLVTLDPRVDDLLFLNDPCDIICTNPCDIFFIKSTLVT